MNKTAMLLAAGLGTRLKERTQDRPKALVEVAGKPLLQHNLENLLKNGFDTIVINIHHYGEQVIRYLETHPFDARIYLSDERGALMDTGGGIVQALPFFHDTPAVLVHNVDILSDIPLHTYYERFLASGDDAWLLTQHRDTTRKLLFDEQDLLIGWKQLKENQYKWVKGPIHDYKERAFNGIHLFKPELFAGCPYQRHSIIDLYLQAAALHRVRSVEIRPTYWFDLGKIEDFDTINHYFERKTDNG